MNKTNHQKRFAEWLPIDNC